MGILTFPANIDPVFLILWIVMTWTATVGSGIRWSGFLYAVASLLALYATLSGQFGLDVVSGQYDWVHIFLWNALYGVVAGVAIYLWVDENRYDREQRQRAAGNSSPQVYRENDSVESERSRPAADHQVA